MTVRVTGSVRGTRWGLICLVAVLIIAVTGVDSADARRRHKRVKSSYHPPYAAIVVDANSGKVLHAANPDSQRHPASLTNILTLYLLFEQIEAGKLKMDSDLPVSAHASVQAPSKLGLRPGQSIEVEDAIKAVVTKSANDVAVVIAEAIGGSEEAFAKMMTRKARALGMSHTVYVNASGLPDDDQITTARDQATLGRAIQDRFPRLYRYFGTRSFAYRGRSIRNHNHLLGRVEGVDGIKTGYVRASGFNLVTSMRRNGRHLVAVVMGGTSGRARDARMRQLLQEYVMEASVRRTAPQVAEAPAKAAAPEREVASADPRLPVRTPPWREEALAAPSASPPPSPGSAAPIQPKVVKTVSVMKRAAHRPVATVQAGAYAVASETSRPAPAPVQQVASVDDAVPASEANAAAVSARAARRGEWVIQVGAFPGEDQAKDRLKSAQEVGGGALGHAEPFTERIVKGEATLYRARFAVLNEDRAKAACKVLKRNEIACLALKN
jgi:D-alanyl-D-alanine carboxypeptidase